MTMTEAPPTFTLEELVQRATAEATVLLPDGSHTVRLKRLDGKRVSKALFAAVETTGATRVCHDIAALGIGYWRAVERLAAQHVGEERAFKIVAIGWVLSQVGSDCMWVLPPEICEAEVGTDAV